jgi:hypothetical protein
MKSGLSLVQLAQEIERQAASKKDYVADTAHVTMESHKDGPALRLGENVVCGVNKLAHRQIGEHVGIPAVYYDRMMAERPDLLAQNVNTWLQDAPKKRLVRTMDGNVRAFLSDRYRPLENSELAEAVLPVLLDLDVEIMSSQITEQRLYIKAVHKSIRKDMPAGSKFGQDHHIFRTQSPGIVISNSEVGAGALSVEVSIFDHVCTNLAVFGQHSMKKYHTGAKHALAGENVLHLLSDETRRMTDAATWAQVGDIVRGAFDEVQFGARVDAIAGLAECRLEGDPVKVVELTARRLSITQVEQKSILRHLIEGADLSALGLYNAVTRTAQDADDYDRASELERMGGKLVELPRTEWRELAKAA